MNTTILEKAAVYVRDFFSANSSEGLYFHNLEHTEEIVRNAEELCNAINISDNEQEIVLVSAWFHDIGYLKKYEDHENSSIQIAEDFLIKNSYPADKIEKVKKCILATKLPQSASNLLEEILCDADLAGLGKKDFLEKTIHLKRE